MRVFLFLTLWILGNSEMFSCVSGTSQTIKTFEEPYNLSEFVVCFICVVCFPSGAPTSAIPLPPHRPRCVFLVMLLILDIFAQLHVSITNISFRFFFLQNNSP